MVGLHLSVLCVIILSAKITHLSGFEFLDWGDKCEIPRHGGFPSVEECNGGKGLVCTGQACECTYKQRYSYDAITKECRRRVGKPCQYVDVDKEGGEEALNKLPFNLKCHANAECVQIEVPVPKYRRGGVVETDKVSMCACKSGLVASKDLNSCIDPPSDVPFDKLFKQPNKKLQFRTPYYT